MLLQVRLAWVEGSVCPQQRRPNFRVCVAAREACSRTRSPCGRKTGVSESEGSVWFQGGVSGSELSVVARGRVRIRRSLWWQGKLVRVWSKGACPGPRRPCGRRRGVPGIEGAVWPQGGVFGFVGFVWLRRMRVQVQSIRVAAGGVSWSERSVGPQVKCVRVRGICVATWKRVLVRGILVAARGCFQFRGCCGRKEGASGSKGSVWPQGGVFGFEGSVWPMCGVSGFEESV